MLHKYMFREQQQQRVMEHRKMRCGGAKVIQVENRIASSLGWVGPPRSSCWLVVFREVSLTLECAATRTDLYECMSDECYKLDIRTRTKKTGRPEDDRIRFRLIAWPRR